MKNKAGIWSEPVYTRLSKNPITEVRVVKVYYKTPSLRDTIPIACNLVGPKLGGLIDSMVTEAIPQQYLSLNDTLLIRMKGVNEIWGPPYTYIISAKDLKLMRPRTLMANNIGQATPVVRLTWQDFSGDAEEGFVIERANGLVWDQVGEVARNVLVHDDSKSLVTGSSYRYRVYAKGKVKELNSEYSDTTSITVTDVETTTAPAMLQLAQNHPNPFNDRTSIVYSLGIRSAVTLTICNLLGQEVARLVNGKILDPGSHEAVFVAHDLPPGLYFCRLQAGSSVLTKKMVLEK